ncbi:hypothetical protein [Catenulispora rubra]|uniref:hypothetical protein n=1 Tax=Catenulispora rubra TaxID=280293 RepID=UPI0018922B2D|nr:hypothetical protein [Catenulispora rubra]
MPFTVVARPTAESSTDTYSAARAEWLELRYRVVIADGAWSREWIAAYLGAG